MKKFTFDSHNPPQEVLDMVGREVWDSWISMKFFLSEDRWKWWGFESLKKFGRLQLFESNEIQTFWHPPLAIFTDLDLVLGSGAILLASRDEIDGKVQLLHPDHEKLPMSMWGPIFAEKEGYERLIKLTSFF